MYVAAYVRISRDPDHLRAGVTRQLADCRRIAELRWPDVELEVFEDNDVSAWSGRRRPAFTAMCAAIRRGEVRAVVAYDLDRLLRHPRDLEALLDLCDETGMRSVVTAKGDLDLTSHDGQLHARILAAVAKKESDDKSRRVRRALQDRAEAGGYIGGRPPFGYELVDGELRIVDEQAAVIREAAGLVLDGASLLAVTRRFGDVDGAPSTHQGWRKLLLSPTVAGRTNVGTGRWQPILEPGVASDVRAALDSPSRGVRHHTTERTNWLTGLLRCGTCGSLLSRVKNSRGQPSYRCSNRVERCQLAILASLVEPFVEGAIFATAPATVTTPTPAPAPTPDPSLAARLDELAADYASGHISRSEWLSARSAVAEQMASTSGTPTRIPAAPSTTPTAENWATWTPTERHRAARWLLRDIVVGPAGTRGHWLGVEERVELVWRR